MSGKWFQGAVGAWAALILLGVVEKWFASIVASAAAGADLVKGVLAPLLAQGQDIDFAPIAQELERAIWWPMRVFVARINSKTNAGDSVSAARGLLWVAQSQGLCVVVQGLVVACQVIRLYRYAAF